MKIFINFLIHTHTVDMTKKILKLIFQKTCSSVLILANNGGVMK
jgi:hypothetical protein